MYFKPVGVPMRDLGVVQLLAEEIEAYRLRFSDKLNQSEAAKTMNTSSSTYQRILVSASEKIAEALTEGKALEFIEN